MPAVPKSPTWVRFPAVAVRATAFVTKRRKMYNFEVGFNNDGILVIEPVTAGSRDEARAKAQPLHPDWNIVSVRWVK